MYKVIAIAIFIFIACFTKALMDVASMSDDVEEGWIINENESNGKED